MNGQSVQEKCCVELRFQFCLLQWHRNSLCCGRYKQDIAVRPVVVILHTYVDMSKKYMTYSSSWKSKPFHSRIFGRNVGVGVLSRDCMAMAFIEGLCKAQNPNP